MTEYIYGSTKLSFFFFFFTIYCSSSKQLQKNRQKDLLIINVASETGKEDLRCDPKQKSIIQPISLELCSSYNS